MKLFKLTLLSILCSSCSSELSLEGEPCFDENDCSGGAQCIQICDDAKESIENTPSSDAKENIGNTPSSLAYRTMISTTSFLTTVLSLSVMAWPILLQGAEAASDCSSGPPQFFCAAPSFLYSSECPSTTNAPSVLIEFTWPGCNKNDKPYGRWNTGIHSCSSFGGLNSITGLYQVMKEISVNNRPVYRRESPTATGAILFLFHKDGSWHVIADRDGRLSPDPSYTASVATVESDAMFVEQIENDAVWKQGFASTRQIMATMTCSDKVFVGGNIGAGAGSGSSGSGGGSGGNCNAGCCLSCNTAGCPSCCC